MVCFLWQSYRDAVDQAVDMFDKLLVRTSTQAQNELDQHLSRQRQAIQVSLATLRSLSRVILDESIPDGELRARLFAEVPHEELTACGEEVGEWVSGKRSDPFHGIVRRHGVLRKFSPVFLNALEFIQDAEGEPTACLRALQVLKELNADGRRNLPANAPIDFISQRLRPIVGDAEGIDRRARECAFLLNCVTSSKPEISRSVAASASHHSMISSSYNRWQAMREDFFQHSGLPSDPKLGRIFKTEFILQYLSERSCAEGSGAGCSKSSNFTPWLEASRFHHDTERSSCCH